MVKCEHCGKEYETDHEMLKDCFVSSDRWTWDIFHNCQQDKGIEIQGYRSQ
ncbi:hypothetical protein V1503_19305 [Bacillus sp. SCS-151]|uniref:hypothetical protein n=1 Tax=Nanhaiella sioensis TaxID=3115293 RepID=UPI003978E9FD